MSWSASMWVVMSEDAERVDVEGGPGGSNSGKGIWRRPTRGQVDPAMTA